MPVFVGGPSPLSAWPLWPTAESGGRSGSACGRGDWGDVRLMAVRALSLLRGAEAGKGASGNGGREVLGRRHRMAGHAERGGGLSRLRARASWPAPHLAGVAIRNSSGAKDAARPGGGLGHCTSSTPPSRTWRQRSWERGASASRGDKVSASNESCCSELPLSCFTKVSGQPQTIASCMQARAQDRENLEPHVRVCAKTALTHIC